MFLFFGETNFTQVQAPKTIASYNSFCKKKFLSNAMLTGELLGCSDVLLITNTAVAFILTLRQEYLPIFLTELVASNSGTLFEF